MRAPELLARLGLDGRDDLAGLVYEQVHLRATPAALDELAPGASRFGGPPDLPPGVAWPTSPSGRPVPMLLQLRLADLAACPAAARLPQGGALLFFATQAENAADDRTVAAAVLHVAADALVRASLPADAADEEYWPALVVSAVAIEPAIATEREEVLDDDGVALLAALPAATRAAWDAAAQITETAGTPHVVFPVRQVGALGLDPLPGEVGLLELRSDWDIGMNWGDAAWITFALPADDLAAARFEHAVARVWIG